MVGTTVAQSPALNPAGDCMCATLRYKIVECPNVIKPLINLFSQSLTLGFIAGLRKKGLGFVFPVIMSVTSPHLRRCISLIIQISST